MVAWGEPLELSDNFIARPDSNPTLGEVFHVARNEHGGSVWTPVVQYFAWRPSTGAEGFHPHWRLDCFVRDHELAPDHEWVGKALANALTSQGGISEPLWVSWHRSRELGGEARGQVFDLD